ncbi:SAM-dependent methyltransferase [Candidatus Methanocrinis natronophilus]|uniref:SAM-dependent methyltransferase n=1 Tax=Candidatus Methanocrinis natronophilus TaxID=3033396 RepID=A0ABT5X8U3_9EURY|nr:SAM-dependent methyltransferase [Candidatus Methanocrinis natronophilus]MDF0591112.1 SAM-dependent methyltransferase [Candidatus Methanocrinis natronophilus]
MPSENRLYIVGIGPGERGQMTRRAVEAISEAESVVGYRPYLELVSDLLGGKRVVSTGMGQEVERAKEAVGLLEEGSVALISSGDPNVYGMAGLGLEVASGRVDLRRVEVVPGITSFLAAACRVGITFTDSVAAISCSDLLTPWDRIEERARIASEMKMPMAIYNPRSRRRTWQLDRILEIATSGGDRDPEVLVAKNVARDGETLFWTRATEILEGEDIREEVDMFTLLILEGEGMVRGEGTAGEGERRRGAAGPEARSPPVGGHPAGVQIVGVGPGDPRHLTLEAEGLLRTSDLLLGAERHLSAVRLLAGGETISHEGAGGFDDRIAARVRAAEEAARLGKSASILFGGDPSTFSSAWRVRNSSKVRASPGVGAFLAAAARVGAPLVNDFALLSGRGKLDGEKAKRLLEGGYAVVLYNQDSRNLSSHAEEICKTDPDRPFALLQDATRPQERIFIGRGEDLARPAFEGRRSTLILAGPKADIREGRIIARRGYERKYDY